ncbi:hypothetical protein DEA8626_02786 [Defluviimonas aquaemixtae]|uniref:Uncharacterized protein n=1 Tax=Albidovulum aquaemixtae TaxID=1542388 RepID=A0A2R8BK02_9RHOB|nr:hypothetical protein [Defluviimonas aquaemixtae]SPH23719.1 hypothetical protein DEA8626_02786 [Defluviimonas aquaemixtae]
MPLPLAPIAGFALRYGAIAVAAYGLRRVLRKGRTDQRAEDALDDMDEGIAVHHPTDRGQTNASARFRRVINWGKGGVEIDAAALARFRVRRV